MAWETLGFGRNSAGQLGVAEGTQQSLSVPTRISSAGLESAPALQQIACGDVHTLALTSTGAVFAFGNNGCGQLAREDSEDQHARPAAASLGSVVVASVACGARFSLCATDRGDVFAWGCNDYGQLGIGSAADPSCPQPRPVVALRGKRVSQLAAGACHSIALARSGEVFAWGDGRHGQLARFERRSGTPLLVEALQALPIVHVASGNAHVLAVSVSGNVYCWGANGSGQLGLGDKEDRFSVSVNVHLRGKRIVSVSCGATHSAALGSSGILFTFGDGGSFQLGHGGDRNETQPRVVSHFEGMRVIAVECGRLHTVCVRRRDNGTFSAYAWGNNAFGQLGLGDFEPRPTPCLLPGLAGRHEIKLLACGSDHTIAVASAAQDVSQLSPLSQSPVPFEPAPIAPLFIDFLNETMLEALLLRPAEELEEKVMAVFSNAACLSASFLKQNEVYLTGPSHSGLDVGMAKRVYSKLISTGSASLMATLLTACARAAGTLVAFPPREHEGLRSLLVLMQNPLLATPNNNKQTVPIVDRIVKAIVALDDVMRWSLTGWFGRMHPDSFLSMIRLFEGFLVFMLSVFLDCREVLSVLSMLNDANEEANLVPYQSFYSLTASRNMDIRTEYAAWRSNSHATSILRFPFLLDPVAKSSIFDIDAAVQQQSNPYFLFGQILLFHIRREFLVQDALTSVATVDNPIALKCPLKVVFDGEQAIDEGGVRKEFFQLVVRQIFDVDLGLFVYNKESGTYFFNALSFESAAQFHLIGVLCGLAIFNRVLLDIRFPLVVYKMMLHKKPQLQDVLLGWPELGKNLFKLLEYEGDVEEDFGLTFSVTQNYFGEIRTIDLKENGRNTPVTVNNRREYVDLFVQWFCLESVKKQFEPFLEGFERAAASPVLSLFRAEELENLICGEVSTTDIDMSQLEEVCKYEGGFHRDHPTVRFFWEVAKELPSDLKRKLLFFTTGSDRIPVGGLRSMRFMIQREGPDSNRLPSAATCFNILLLPEYQTKEKLRWSLITAIQNCEGFGLK